MPETDELYIDPERTADFLSDYIYRRVEEAGRDGVIVGLSGGLDSAVSAFLAVRALGSSRVSAISMPYRTSSPASRKDAERVAAKLDIRCPVVDITPQIDGYFERFPEADRMRRGNKMARERMSILYDHSQVQNALVQGTGNKTEIMLGYSTLWGDMACAYTPIGNLYKTQVRALAAWLEVPREIIVKLPTADLYVGQTDEGEMGFSYHDVDRLLFDVYDKRLPRKELLHRGYLEEFIDEVTSRVEANSFKRRMPGVPDELPEEFRAKD